MPNDIERRWGDWEQNLPDKVEIPRAFGMNQVAIKFIKLHVFCDASINGTGSVVQTVIYQEGTEFQGLVASKARLSRRGLTIPRLELIGAHMTTNFVTMWLHWIMGNGRYKQL